jgi:hypothetical protein
VVTNFSPHPWTSASAHRHLETPHTASSLVGTCLHPQTTICTPQKQLVSESLRIPLVALLQLIPIAVSGHKTSTPTSRALCPLHHHMTIPCHDRPRKPQFKWTPHDPPSRLRKYKPLSMTALLLPAHAPRDHHETLHEMACITHSKEVQVFHLATT